MVEPIFASPIADTIIQDVEKPLEEEGFAFLQAQSMQSVLECAGLIGWDTFAASWNDLGVDRYMADGGRYRRRRYATFSLTDETITRKPHQPHYQSRDYNTLNGGIERWFKPVLPAIGEHPALMAILRLALRVITDMTPPQRRPRSWHTEIHQFRIEARPDAAGCPTPEGLHRDGVDWVFVVMVRRENVARGETSIHDLNHKQVGSFTLTNPMDTAIVNDNRVYHGVTPVQPVDPDRPAYRDVLVVTLRHE
ncbi:2OG-Fe dioxygenase family protein [Acetobacter okinawensis]|uniref:2OG-Fe dioxygenase family protein n=1 Tax=Acetobacter okinawensis TaxID=1076594 RepID=UPI001BA9E5A3|nr:2OG-Fe dioxygenase family protein [Acetobacter okinawensis]MBS0965719.1 2OG-Fe dioxygenase family protein [Acetobacter okinawensis]